VKVHKRAATAGPVEAETASRPPGRPRRASTDDAIVAAALTLVAERGFRAATIDAIVARAGVGKNTVYRRWSSKEDLIADAIGSLTAEVEPHDGDDLYELLLAHLRDLQRVFGDPLLGRILPGVLGELQANPQFAAAWADRVVRPRRQAIVALVERGTRDGALRHGTDPELIADLLVGPPFVREIFPFGLPELPERYADDLLAAIWRGIAPERPVRLDA
jgi:AcrR family transcriptional regulator